MPALSSVAHQTLSRGPTLGQKADRPAKQRCKKVLETDTSLHLTRKSGRHGKGGNGVLSSSKGGRSLVSGEDPGCGMCSQAPPVLRGAFSLARNDKCGNRAINILSHEKMDREKSLAVTKRPRSSAPLA